MYCKAQDTALIHYLINRISAQQVKSDDFFLSGIFPSYISKHESFNTKKKDNNIFFNGLIAYTLNDIKPKLDQESLQITDAALNKSKPLFSKFKNIKGRNTYNFWRTDSVYDYPYSGMLKMFTKDISLPDDMDDTVLSLLALDVADSTAEAVHALMQQFVNCDSNKVRSVIEDYNQLGAYSTWFGKKFPVVFDVSVLCNVLSFVQLHNLSWTKADSACLTVIVKTIEQNYHLGKAVYASPYYPKASLILYHVARLMSIKPIPQLESLKIKILSDAAKELALATNAMEKVILSSTILKLGYEPPPIAISINEIARQIEQNDFCFFVGNISSYFKDFSKAFATANEIGFFYHYCPAYNDALLLEYLVLRNE
ncbi:hypothetical protein FRZ67_02535 [Panacibacter ginsenosidivorans]|uniref:Uncharacterized protein n=1 Tax=Panacibacter ginsenosidivorans TaxID=1813871 RepID=A0A5B8V3Y6_9BACT|nr:hypothetical protein [Panacibacter ginsenosidivorans]QEC66237.1 hypothetical protein FRZ67_02535 [Panacibacter ginsenosidivorans]